MGNLLINIDMLIYNYSHWGVILSFLGGVLVTLSPCILPILPITLSVVGEASLNTKAKNFIISVVFVSGITLTYVTLGIVASLFGIFIGKTINSLLIYLILGIVFIVLGLSFFDLIHLTIFSINYRPKRTLISIFILGLLSGLSMLPCAFPILGTILTLISLRHNIIYGIACLLSFSLGYGLILFLIGSSTSLVRRLSSKGIWFIIVKKGLGLLILLTGLYFMVSVFRYL